MAQNVCKCHDSKTEGGRERGLRTASMEDKGASAFASVVTRIEDSYKRERQRASESTHAHGRESARAQRDREREKERERDRIHGG